MLETFITSDVIRCGAEHNKGKSCEAVKF